MADNEQKAMQLMAEAEKKLNSSKSFLGSLFGGSSKVEEAVDCYLRAANLFKMSKKWPQAGQAFCSAAQLHLKAGVRHDAATNFVDASNCYKKCDPNEAVSCLLKAIEIYTDMGRFTVAAKQHQSACQLFLQNGAVRDGVRGPGPRDAALRAGGGLLPRRGVHLLGKQVHAQAGAVRRPIAKSSLDNSLLKYSAKEYMFRAALCHLCVDLLNAQHALEKYSALYPAFADTRECKLVKELIEHLEDQNVEAFTEAVKTFDSISRLDQWFTTMLVRVKKQINDNPDLR
ncbi:hypothetical protein O3G_MSEX004282 [Manduca sexta]|uniref:Alpha-soluble NSF attachment protein n=1 Tax=Manduca sexta TaxID=7130 RepID=A0A921YUV0_MANSE|nr:hypothetical protein O3G_MSEX004282 [Manduca sexta]